MARRIYSIVLRACLRCVPALSILLVAVQCARLRAQRVMFDRTSKHRMLERSAWWLISCAVQCAKGLSVAVLARAVRGQPRVPQWGYLFELYALGLGSVVRYGEQALWEGHPDNYTAVRKIMNIASRPVLPMLCYGHNVRVVEVQCTPTSYKSLMLETQPLDTQLDDCPCVWIIYFHGGGYAAGNPPFGVDIVARIANILEKRAGSHLGHRGRIKVQGLLVRYSLAPEHPYPAALDDAVAAYRWLLQSSGVPLLQRPFRSESDFVVLAGDSAGGGLSLAATLRIQALGLAPPSCAYCISPMLDCSWGILANRVSAASVELDCVQPLLADGCARNYMLGSNASGVFTDDHSSWTHRSVSDYFASPKAASDAALRSLPPVLVQTGGLEIFAEDARELATRWTSACAGGFAHSGGITLKEWEGMVHCFQLCGAISPVAQAALEEGADFILAHTLGKASKAEGSCLLAKY